MERHGLLGVGRGAGDHWWAGGFFGRCPASLQGPPEAPGVVPPFPVEVT